MANSSKFKVSISVPLSASIILIIPFWLDINIFESTKVGPL